VSSTPPPHDQHPTAAEPARTPDGDRVAFDPAGRPPAGELALTARKYLLILGITLGLVLLWLLRDLLIVTLLAALIASGMYGVVHPLERQMPRLAAVAVAYVALLALLAVAAVLVAPPLVDQAADLLARIPALFDRLRAEASVVIDAVGGPGTGEQMFDQLTPPIVDGEVDEEIVQLPFTVLQVLVNVTITIFLSALLLLERDAIRGWTSRFLVARDRGPAIDLARTAVTKLGAYVRGQLLVMTITGVGTAAGMMVLGVPFALPMGVLGFLAEAIPLAGPIIAGVPVLLLAFLESPTTGLLMLAWLVVLQQLEGWFIYPIVQGRILSLSPIVVVLGVLAGAAVYGILGALIAVPIVAIVDVVLREVVFPLRQAASRRDMEAARQATRTQAEPG
jgi:predicted PurR-regulated permease PerM